MKRSIVAFAVILYACLAMALIAMPTNAATGDGTYDFTWMGRHWVGMNGNTPIYSYEPVTIPDFLIISDGQISSRYVDYLCDYTPIPGIEPVGDSPTKFYTFTGSVDSDGNADWIGGSAFGAGFMVYSYGGVINSDGTGLGSWSKPEMESGTWSAEKSGGFGGGGGGSFGIGNLGLPDLSTPAAGLAVAGAVAGLAASLLPAPKPGFRPIQEHFPTNQTLVPSVISETNPSMIGPPELGQPQGGAGLTYGYADPTIWTGPGPPPPPKDWFSSVSQNAPQCPFHPGTHTVVHYRWGGNDDPGSWYCPHCKSYPWGITR